MSIRRITASVTFDPPIDDEEEAAQTLGEAVLDDSATVTFDRPADDDMQKLVRNLLEAWDNANLDDGSPTDVVVAVSALRKASWTWTEDDPNLALWFTPQAIREHFNARSLADDGDPANDELFLKVADMTDEQLAEVGRGCLSDDVLYEAFHECLVLALEG